MAVQLRLFDSGRAASAPNRISRGSVGGTFVCGRNGGCSGAAENRSSREAFRARFDGVACLSPVCIFFVDTCGTFATAPGVGDLVTAPGVGIFVSAFSCRWSLCSVVVVASGFLLGVDVGWWGEPGDAGVDVDFPVFFVDEVVVVGAEEDAVVGAGGSAV
jgi:hypothetical protein